MTAAFDFDEHHFAVRFATAPCFAGDLHSVVGLVRQRHDLGLGFAAVGFHPVLDSVID
jgi:hypothetical protein